jgi:hypothetical protein
MAGNSNSGGSGRFEKGKFDPSRQGKGGARPNSGRKSPLFKIQCQQLSRSEEFFEWGRRIFKGEAVVPQICEGVIVNRPANATERTYLWDKITSYVEPKAMKLGLDEETRISLSALVEKARASRGLEK